MPSLKDKILAPREEKPKKVKKPKVEVKLGKKGKKK